MKMAVKFTNTSSRDRQVTPTLDDGTNCLATQKLSDLAARAHQSQSKLCVNNVTQKDSDDSTSNLELFHNLSSPCITSVSNYQSRLHANEREDSYICHYNKGLYDPRILKTVDPSQCILDGSKNNVFMTDKMSNFFKASNLNEKMSIVDRSFLFDSNLKNTPEFYSKLDNIEITNSQYYQEYLYDDPIYANTLENNRSFESTSYELDSVISNSNSRIHTMEEDNGTINPIFFHHTPSPNNTTSIRIITSSNRITKLRDRKLIQAIHKSLKQHNSNYLDDNDEKINTNYNGFKTLNDNQTYKLRRLSGDLTSIHIEANEIPNQQQSIQPNYTSCKYSDFPSTFSENIFRGKETQYKEATPRYNDFDSFQPEAKILREMEKERKSLETIACTQKLIDNTKQNALHIEKVEDLGNSEEIKQNVMSKQGKEKEGVEEAEDEEAREELSEVDIHGINITADCNSSDQKDVIKPQMKKVKGLKSNSQECKSQLSQDTALPKRKIVLTFKRHNKKYRQGNSIMKNKERENDCSMNNSFGKLNQIKQVSNIMEFEIDKPKLIKAEEQEQDTQEIEKDNDIVLEIFRASLKRNKDNFAKTKSSDVLLATKIPRVRAQRSNKKNPNKAKDNIYKCLQCPKEFKQRSQWKRHIDCIHLKIAKFACIKCGKAFKRSDHLKNHIRRIHGQP